MKLFSLVISVLVLKGCSSALGGPDIEKTAEFKIEKTITQITGQLTAQAPTLTPLPTLTPISTRAPFTTPLPTAIPTSTPTPTPTPTPVPRFLDEEYLAADGVSVTLRSLSITGTGNNLTVTVSYTLENKTKDLKEEKAWKLFHQGTGGSYFGFLAHLLPGKSIARSFEFNAVAPNGFLAVAYPSGFFDISRHDDDVVWRFPLLPSP